MAYAWVELLTVRIYGKPKGQPRSRSRRGQMGVYDPGTADGWKAIVAHAFLPHVPAEPYDEPLRFDIDIYFPRPRSFNKRTRDAYGGRSKDIPDGAVLFTGKPDRDNADKAILDAVGGVGFYRDDSLVCDGQIRKFYAARVGKPGARVRVMLWRDVGQTTLLEP